MTFTDPTLDSVVIRTVHLVQIRSALDGARSGLGLSQLSYTDPFLTGGSTPVRALHLQEILNSVK